jgi:sugar/nucleoside kinase (ribokinase family)
LSPDPDSVIAGQPLGPTEHDQLASLIEQLVAVGDVETLVVKRGSRGVTVMSPDGTTEMPSFSVEAINTVGAGDAFAAGLIRSRLRGWDWRRASLYANACGAIQVTRHGCSASFPSEAEVTAFIVEHGGP